MATPTWPTAGLYGVGAVGDALNARTAANNLIAQSQAQTKNVLDNIAFNNAQRADAMTWGRQQLADEIAFANAQRQQEQTYTTSSLADKIALERRNLEREVQVAQANREATLGALLENIASQQAATDAQRGLIDAEQGRQQSYARGQRDALDANAGLFNNFNGQMGDTAGGIADAVMQAITGASPAAQAPAARGVTAEREAALRDQARSMVASDVQRSANVNALGQLLSNIGVATGRNSQISDLLANFAKGSQATLDPALKAAGMTFDAKPILQDTVATEQYINPGQYIGPKYISAGRFVGENYVNNPMPAANTNMLGDLLKIGSNIGLALDNAGAFNAKPKSSVNYSLSSGSGGPGLKLGGSGSGLVLRSNLGID